MSTRATQSIYNIDDLVRNADRLGSFFFAERTMKSFGTRLLQTAFYPVSFGNEDGQPAVGYFVTTEKTPDAWMGRGTGRMAVLRRYVLKEDDAWSREDRHDVINFETMAHPLTTARAKTLGHNAAQIEHLEGYEKALAFIEAATK